MHYAIQNSIGTGAIALLSTFVLTTLLSWSTPVAAMSYMPKTCELAEDRYVTIKSTTGHYLHEQDDGTLAGLGPAPVASADSFGLYLDIRPGIELRMAW